MSTLAVVLLAVTAVSTLTMAVAQVWLFVVAGRLARKVDQLSADFERDVRPLVAKVQVIAENASRASALAVAQVERADRLFGDLARRVEDTVAVVQHGLLAPAREGKALWAGVGAAVGAFRQLRQANRPSGRGSDEENPLFIG